jgi:hypothetical protein
MIRRERRRLDGKGQPYSPRLAITALGKPEVKERVVSFFNKHLRGQDVKVSGEPIQAASNPSG